MDNNGLRSSSTHTSQSSKSRALLLGIAFLSLFAWHLYHGVTGDHWWRPPLSHGDGPDYESLAFSLSRGDGFQFAWQSEEWQQPYLDDRDAERYTQLQRIDWPGPTASRPPAYPFLISLVYRVMPRGPLAFATVRLLSVLFTSVSGALAVWMGWELAKRMTRSVWMPPIAALIAFVLAMLDRTVRTYSVDFLTEPMAMFLCVCVWASGLIWQQPEAPKRWFAIMVSGSAALILTRSITIFWLPGLAILVAMSATKARLRWAAGYVLIVLALLSPWWIRNASVLQSMMPLGGQGAASLRGGYCDEALADFGNWHGDAEERLQHSLNAIPGAGDWTQAQREVALAHRANQETWQWVQANLTEIPRLIGMRIVSHWSPFSGTSLLWRLAILAGWLVMVISRRREALWIVGMPLISTIAVALLYETGGRFLVPLYPLLYMTAGLGIALIADHLIACNIALKRK
jgi:4-amino-4-deoxy-L-arabinose transferase-like glycosyltransferase